MNPNKSDVYAQSGVDYGSLDPVKILSQMEAMKTKGLLRWGLFVEESMGESSSLIKMPDGGYMSLVLEGLGTKSVVAQTMYELTGNPVWFYQCSQCALMMILNDLVTSGAMPFAVNMYLAAGSSEWFQDRKRAIAIAEGFRKGCEDSKSAWIGGETPVLKNIIYPGAFDIAGCAAGVITEEKNRILGNIEVGDIIIGASSNGSPMANAFTLMRKIGDRKNSWLDHIRHLVLGHELKALEKGYLTDIGDGVTYGEAILRTTPCYVEFIRECQKLGIPIKYAVNVTGHGWRKFMRANLKLTHRLRSCYHYGIFAFIRRHGPDGVISLEDMYANFNMGVGFAVWVHPKYRDKVYDAAHKCGIHTFVMGEVEASPDGKKRVIIEDLNITYEEDTLAIR